MLASRGHFPRARHGGLGPRCPGRCSVPPLDVGEGAAGIQSTRGEHVQAAELGLAGVAIASRGRHGLGLGLGWGLGLVLLARGVATAATLVQELQGAVLGAYRRV
jgi:hypothetical protein